MKMHTVLRQRTPAKGRAAVYNVCEVVGEHRLSENEVELAIAPAEGGFAPVLSIREDMLYRAGYDVDEAASIALEKRRADAAEKVLADRADLDPPTPWSA